MWKLALCRIKLIPYLRLELHEFLGQQNETGQKIILPLLLNVTREQLVEHYPELSEIQYIDSKSVTNEEITILLAKELIKRYK